MTDEAPTVRTRKDVEEHHGERVRVIGEYTLNAVFKGQPGFLVAFIDLEDGTQVVLDYGVDAARMVLLQDKLVAAYGKILRTYPNEEEQYLDLPHLVDLEEINRIDPDTLAIVSRS